MVPFKSNSSAAPSLAHLRTLFKATFILRVPSSTLSSKFLKSRLSQTLIAFLCLLSFWPMRIPSGLYPYAPKGEVPAVPTHLLPPWCRPFCSSSLFFRVYINFSNPPNASISAISSLVKCFSAILVSQSFGKFTASSTSSTEIFSKPLKVDEKT